MFLIGLTGGIAAGKTTVAAHWVSLGGIEIDADKLAREVVEPGTQGLDQIKQVFGDSVFDSDGTLDRKVLGDVVFNDAEKRRELEAIIHPLVRARAQQLISELPEDAMVIYTVPLLVEANVSLPFDAIVSVEAPEIDRVNRLVASRGLSPEQALARVKAQASAIERAAAADFILNSNQPLVALFADASSLWRKFEAINQGRSK
jgi:dephospho-CoA kinase